MVINSRRKNKTSMRKLLLWLKQYWLNTMPTFSKLSKICRQKTFVLAKPHQITYSRDFYFYDFHLYFYKNSLHLPRGTFSLFNNFLDISAWIHHPCIQIKISKMGSCFPNYQTRSSPNDVLFLIASLFPPRTEVT